jgi:hypothetical protein
METLQLQLGDIIQIDSPSDDKYNEKVFLISYIDSSQIEIQNITSLAKTSLLLDEEGELEEESIEGISLLSRDENQGYTKQNGLLSGIWIDITFGGDLPAIITGEITNLEEDMIEIKTYPENDIIYIDFAYKGIPKDIPITKIEVREPPALDIIDPGTDESVTETPEIVPEVKEQIQDIIISADDIQFGNDLGEITQQVAVDESQERFGIQTQTNDLLDELLAKIPTNKRNSTLLNKIHLIIERFKQLRTHFSDIDKNGNPIAPTIKTAAHKPLVNSLKNLNKNLLWIMPVVQNRKILYDVDEDLAENSGDVISTTLAESQLQHTSELDNFYNNSVPDNENKYNYLLKTIEEIGNPYRGPEDEDSKNYLTQQNVEANLNVIVDNLDEFYSSVVGNKDPTTIERKRFLITKYNLGFNKLETIVEQGSKPFNRRVPATNSNKVYLKSLILLPEDVIRYSRVNLPTSSILLKSTLNRENMYYYKKLNTNTNINSQVIESFDEKFENNDFLETPTELVLDTDLQNDPEKYEKYLQTIIPRTRVLFSMIQKYINEKLTLNEVVKELEPFLVYNDDLTFKQYSEINKFIRNKIGEYKKNYVAKNRDFRQLASGKKYADRTIYSLFNILEKNKKSVLSEGYNLSQRNYASSENYAKIMSMDSGRLFMTTLTLENFLLLTPIDINEILERDYLTTKENTEKPNECKNYVLTKKYLELDELLDDNDKVVYVDKNLDQTRYDIIEEYKVETESMSEDEFKNFLIDKLITNIGLTEEIATIDATSMIEGKREVREGEYASLSVDGGEKTYYYKRVNDKWERDESIPDVKLNNDMFCNIQQPCIKIKKDCVDEKIGEENIKETSLQELIKEFDITYEVSKEELMTLIQNRYDYFQYQLKVFQKLDQENRYKYNDKMVKLGLSLEEQDDIQVSPYLELRDAILGQYDVVKRNNDIIKLHNLFLREANENEDKYWFYCIETNTKVLPTFIVTLAKVFINNQYDYVRTLDQICREQGKLSDDGDSWVDEHSGYVIKKVAFDTEEGYDEAGFKAQSREVLLESMKVVNDTEEDKKFSDPNAEKINNIMLALGGYMGIPIQSFQEFVIQNTLLVNKKIVPNEAEYNKKREMLMKKGKKVPSYEDAYNTSLMLLTLSYYLVGIQINVPSLKTKKQFPGCKKAFNGFPLEGSDEDGLNYVACVANKIKSKVTPWNVLAKLNQTGIVKRMKELINKYIVPDTIIQQKINEKREYLLLETSDDIPLDLNVQNWQTFLPPLIPIKNESRDELRDTFKNDLIKDLQKGKPEQLNKILALKSMTIHYSMVIFEEVYKIIKKELPILTNNADEAFLENACCIDSENQTTIQYFMSKQPLIEKYNNIIKEYQSIISDINDVTLASNLYSPIDTRRVFPKLSSQFSEKTIYQAFITFCNFGSLFPVPEELQGICLTKPENFSILDPLQSQITQLKSDGKNYTSEEMNLLMKIINKQNKVNISLYDDTSSSLDKLRNYLENDSTNIPEKLYKLLISTIDTFDISIQSNTPQMKELINYLDKTSSEIRLEIIEFLQNNSKLSKRKMEPIIAFFRENWWKDQNNDDEKRIHNINFMKNCIYQMIKVFPNIILNEVDYDSVKIPSHWKLSQRHNSDVRNIIYNYYNKLSTYYGKSILKPIFSSIYDKVNDWITLLNKVPIFESISNETYAVINPTIVEAIAELVLLESYKAFIFSTSVINIKKSDDLSVTTSEELLNEEIGNISEMDIISGEKLEQNETIASLLITFTEMFISTKKTINYNYEDVIYRVNVSKEKEKDQFTKRLKELSDEEREIENMLKGHKLGTWSKGLSKGVTQYVKDNYDEERMEMEKTIQLESQLGKQDFVSSMNRDIYMMDLETENLRAQEIEAEESMINYQGEDADYEEMGMDGDEMY